MHILMVAFWEGFQKGTEMESLVYELLSMSHYLLLLTSVCDTVRAEISTPFHQKWMIVPAIKMKIKAIRPE